MPAVLARVIRMGMPVGVALCIWFSGPARTFAQAPHPDPATLINRAMSLVVTCAYGIKASQEKDGVVKTSDLSAREKAMQSKMSVIVFFRPGRFAFTGMWGEKVRGTDVWTVTFAPAASGQPAARAGEDPRLNEAMNNMTGFAQIDQATGGLVHAQAWLKSKMFFADVITRFGIPAPVTVTILSANLTLDQRLSGKAWVPDKASVDVWAFASWWILATPVHYSYPVSFTCGKESEG